MEDLVQETYLKLCADECRLLRNFDSRHPEAIYGFVKVVATNVAHDYFKTHFAAKRGGSETTERVETTEAIEPTSPRNPPTCLSTVELTIFLRQIDEYLSKVVSPADLTRSREIFWLYYRSGLSASAIASLPDSGLTTKGVESMLFRLTRSLKLALATTDQVPRSESKALQDRQKDYRERIRYD